MKLTNEQEDLVLEAEIHEEIKCPSCGCSGRFGDEEDGFITCECGEQVEVFK